MGLGNLTFGFCWELESIVYLISMKWRTSRLFTTIYVLHRVERAGNHSKIEPVGTAVLSSGILFLLCEYYDAAKYSIAAPQRR